jgi:hypothetical protein
VVDICEDNRASREAGLELLELIKLEEPEVLATLITKEGKNFGPQIFGLYHTLNLAGSHLLKIANLIRPEALRKLDELEATSKDARLKDKELLSIIIIEDENQFSTPEKLAQVLTSVSELYEVCLALEEREARSHKDESIIVIACDSGSDKSFDFLGVANAIAGLKDIFHGLYDRIFFRKEHQTGLQLDLIAKSLPLYEKLAVMENEGKIQREQAELYKRKIINSSTQLVEARVIIPELSERATAYDPRKLPEVIGCAH